MTLQELYDALTPIVAKRGDCPIAVSDDIDDGINFMVDDFCTMTYNHSDGSLRHDDPELDDDELVLVLTQTN